MLVVATVTPVLSRNVDGSPYLQRKEEIKDWPALSNSSWMMERRAVMLKALSMSMERIAVPWSSVLVTILAPEPGRYCRT